ncbi:hypothetical protein VB618_11475 [Microvirga sp. CF3062]|uniref:hypothetical protein n=1 Tax=Microvirga sp. CF3062 TaxID=3110182 RepID=UPI002E75D5D3|nr:hypothetical protein [Microvirga sp. CF3062]MEE1656818.1 hypothetical protein [Microvirga sp. CF3062]
MSSTGNRSNPNHTRIAGHQGQDEPNVNASGKPDIGRQGGATHQESRDHNKHNNSGQSGHKPQQHRPEQEKH